MDTLGVIVAVGALVVGLMLLTGHGSFFMQTGTDASRKKVYDDKKVEKASGIAFIVTAALSAIDLFTTTMTMKIAYLAALILVFGVLIWYIVNKCKI